MSAAANNEFFADKKELFANMFRPTLREALAAICASNAATVGGYLVSYITERPDGKFMRTRTLTIVHDLDDMFVPQNIARPYALALQTMGVAVRLVTLNIRDPRVAGLPANRRLFWREER